MLINESQRIRREAQEYAQLSIDYMEHNSYEEQMRILSNYAPERVAPMIEKFPGIRKRLDAYLDLLQDHAAPDGLKTALFFAFYVTLQRIAPEGESHETAIGRREG